MFQWTTKVSSKNIPWIVLFVYLPWLIFLLRAYLGLSISMAQKYLFIAISFYQNIVCQNVSCE